MGSSGISFQLESIGGRTATDARVKTVTLDTLFKVWGGRRGSFLPYEWQRFACDWIGLGEDSLLTIEVDGGSITFWFYETVAWSEGLAQHWLSLTLAVRRGDFEAAFARLGYRINSAEWPDLKSEYLQTRARFFHGDNGIGETTSDGVYWQVKNGNIDVPCTPMDELSADARLQAEHVIATNRCHCCVCKSIWNWTPDLDDVPGFHIERESIFISRSLSALDIRPEGYIVAAGGQYDSIWTARATSIAGPWDGIVGLSDPKRHLDGIFANENTLVAHAQTNSGARYISTSLDGGKTWSEQTLHSPFGKAKRVRLFRGATPNEVFAAAEPPKTLFRSQDAGQTFEALANPPQCDGQPILEIYRLANFHSQLFACICIGRAAYKLVVSDDQGASFRAIELERPAKPCQLVTFPGGIACILQEDSNVVLLRSTNGGTSFTRHIVGPGVFTSAAAGPQSILVALGENRGVGGGGVFVAEDGVTFVLASKIQAQNVFVDPSGDRLGFLFAKFSLFSLRRG
jgi:hypothetical protein